MRRHLSRLLLGLPVALFVCSVAAGAASYFVTCSVARSGIVYDPNPPLGPRTVSSLALVDSGNGALAVRRTVRASSGGFSPPGSRVHVDFGRPDPALFTVGPPVSFKRAIFDEGSDWVFTVRYWLLVPLTAAVALPAFIAWRRRRARGRTGPGGFPALSPADGQRETGTS